MKSRRFARASALAIFSVFATTAIAPALSLAGSQPAAIKESSPATRATFTSATATVNGLQMTVWTKPGGGGAGTPRIASSGGRLWFVERNTGKMTAFSAAGTSTDYALPNGLVDVRAVTAGRDERNIWFAAYGAGVVGNVSNSGAFQTSPTGTPTTTAVGAAMDWFGQLWLATLNKGIGVKRLSGATAFYPITDNTDEPTTVTLGGDGAIWFVERAGPNVGKIGNAGVVIEYAAGLSDDSGSYGIAAGPDGRIWFTDPARKRIGRMLTNGTGLTYFTAGLTGTPVSIVAGPDNKLYFGEREGKVGRISVSGAITEYAIPGSTSTDPFAAYGLTVGPNGNIWFANNNRTQVGQLKINTASVDCVKKVWDSLEACGWPGPANTGFPAGQQFKNTSGRTITVDGTIIDGERITGVLYINAKNVTVKNSWITSNTGGANGSGVIKVLSGATAIIANNRLDGSNATHAGIWFEGARLAARRNDIFGVNDGIFSWDADNFAIEDNYLHNFTTQAANGHIDGFQTEGASNGVIRHNTFRITQDQNAAVAIWNGRRNSSNILVENNLMMGGGFTVYAEDYHPSEQNPAGGYSVTNIRILNNKFSTANYPCVGDYGVWFTRGAPTDGWRRSGNRVLETWESIDTRNPSVNGWECR